MNEIRPITANERRITLASVMIVFLLSGISQTVVTTALPRIIADLDGLSLYAWVQTAYLLTSTVMVPIWGKLGDLFGRKPVLLASIGIFLAGSWLSGLSGEFGDLPLLGGGMTQLIFFRALQGIGGGGLFTVAFAIIADLYSPRERAQFAGLFGAVFGVANVFGPVIGGFLADHGTGMVLGHLVQGWSLDPQTYLDVKYLYQQALDDDKYDGYYAATNPNEYFAEATQAYFIGTGARGRQDREWLEEYDPALFELVDRVYNGR